MASGVDEAIWTERTTRGVSPWNLIILGAVTMLGPLSIDLYLPSFPELARELQASESAVQLTLTACVIGLAAGQLIAGPLSDAFGRKGPILFGTIGWSIASLICALAPSITTLTLLRLAQGLAGAAGVVVARAVIRDLATGEQLTRAFARLMLVIGVVPILAPTMGGLLLRVTSWRGVFVVLAVLGTLIAVSTALTLRESLPREARDRSGVRGTIAGYGYLLRDRTFVAAALVLAFTFASLFIYVGTSSFVLRDVFELSPTAYGFLFGANSVALIGGSQLSPWLSVRMPARTLITGSVLLAVASAAALLVFGAAGVGGLAGVAVPLWLMVLAVGISMPVATTRAMSRHPERAGTASALLGVLQMGTGALIIPLVGLFGSTSVIPLGVALVLSLLVALAIHVGSAQRAMPVPAAA